MLKCLLDVVRYKFASKLVKMASAEIKKGDLKHIKRGLDFLELSIGIVPSSKELMEFGCKLRDSALELRNQLEQKKEEDPE